MSTHSLYWRTNKGKEELIDGEISWNKALRLRDDLVKKRPASEGFPLIRRDVEEKEQPKEVLQKFGKNKGFNLSPKDPAPEPLPPRETEPRPEDLSQAESGPSAEPKSSKKSKKRKYIAEDEKASDMQEV
ncbi:hypothetical protein LCGC14_1530970 [marine sediment metagenome]|uniref:Uncharacterized protein n=1 Tax=marine sediment metagenome TaxID=412755 RepID=A0A0F9LBN8_9ZZZZ